MMKLVGIVLGLILVLNVAPVLGAVQGRTQIIELNDWLFLVKVCASGGKSLHQQYVTVKTDKGQWVYNLGIHLGMGQCKEYTINPDTFDYQNKKSVKVLLTPDDMKLR